MYFVVSRTGNGSLKCKRYNKTYEILEITEGVGNIIKIFHINEGHTNNHYKEKYYSLDDEILLLVRNNAEIGLSISDEYSFERTLPQIEVDQLPRVFRAFNPMTKGITYLEFIETNFNESIKEISKDICSLTPRAKEYVDKLLALENELNSEEIKYDYNSPRKKEIYSEIDKLETELKSVNENLKRIEHRRLLLIENYTR